MPENRAAATRIESKGAAELDPEFAAFCAQHSQSMPLTKESLAQLPREVELEFYRRMPWDNFIELTFGMFEDDPLVVLREVDHGVWEEVS